LKQQQQMSCRDMELLCRQQAVFDTEHRWKWLGQAERWEYLAQEEAASRVKKNWPNGDGTEHHRRR
jgi:hypothetical protein